MKALLTNNFSPGVYNLFIGTDDHYAISFDGGSTFPYSGLDGTGLTATVNLNGSTSMVYNGDNSGGGPASYVVTITGVNPVAGTLVSNQTCGGSGNTSIVLSGFTGYIQWQTSTDANTWSNTGSLTLNGTLSVNPSSTTFYRAVVNSNGTTATSNPVGIVTGTYSGNFTINANVALSGTLNVNGDFTIPTGITVTVSQGCPLQVNANNITVNGTINADGAGNTGGSGGSGGFNANCNSGCSRCNNIAQAAGSGSGGATGNGSGAGIGGSAGSRGDASARSCNSTAGFCNGNNDGNNDGGPGAGGGGGGSYGGAGASAIALKGGNGWNRNGSGASPTGGAGGSINSTYGSADLSTETISMGSGGAGGGGGGGGSDCGGTGGSGGNGGGSIFLNASRTLTVGASGLITANGATGGTGGAGSVQQGGYNTCTTFLGYTCSTTYDGTGGGGAGAGGGSGGGILLESFGTATIAGTIRANGGAGGNGGAQGDGNSQGGMGGAGGGGGRIKIATNTCQNNSITATMTTTAGGAGTGANGNSNGTGGNNGTINSTIVYPGYVAFTAGGTISSNQAYCNSATPAAFTGTTVTGGTNAYYYEWFSCTGGSCGTPTAGNASPGSGWTDRGGSTSSTGFTESGTLTQTTTYVRGVVSTYSNGTGAWGSNTLGSCIEWSNIATVTINPLPTASISGTTAVCVGATAPNVTFTGANGTAPYTFTYKINSGSNQTVTTTSGN